MRFREWYPSKEITEHTVHFFASLLRESGLPDFLLGWFTLFFHIAGGLTLIMLLLFFPLNSLYGLFCLAWCLWIFSNSYFHGCILSRLERHLFHSDTWYGPLSLGNVLFQFWFAKFTKDIANLVIKYCFAIPVSVIVLLRLVSSGNMTSILSSLLLGSFLTMSAFQSSQTLCMDTLFDWLEKFEERNSE